MNKLNWRYGLSEFTIVVAGVLVALAADIWFQDREDGVRDLEYVERLIADL